MNRQQRKALAKKNRKAALKARNMPAPETIINLPVKTPLQEYLEQEEWLWSPSDPFIVGLSKIGRFINETCLVWRDGSEDHEPGEFGWRYLELPLFHPRKWTFLEKYMTPEGVDYLVKMHKHIKTLEAYSKDSNADIPDGYPCWSLMLDISTGDANIKDHVNNVEYDIKPDWFIRSLDLSIP